MALYEVTLNMTYYGQKCMNRFNYVTDSDESTINRSAALAGAMGFLPSIVPTTLYGRLKTILNTAVTFTGFRIVNMYDPVDFYAGSWSLIQTGLVGGEGLPPYNAYGYISTQTRLDVAAGTKRFVGVNEGSSLAGGGISPTFLTNDLLPFGDLLGASLTYDDEGSTLTFDPVVLGRLKYTTPSGKFAYKKYPTEAEQLEHASIGGAWQAYQNVRSQVSRQYGRGQ